MIKDTSIYTLYDNEYYQYWCSADENSAYREVYEELGHKFYNAIKFDDYNESIEFINNNRLMPL